jgi:tetrahydromethanopterin S-methyltransferase subunit F
MSKPINPRKAGLVLGVVLAGWHLCWSLLVAFGLAQPVIDFVFWIHFIKPVYQVEPFELVRALILLCVTGAIGFLVGLVFALVWNRVQKD